MMWKNTVNFIGCDAEYEEAQVVLFGAPFDSTTSFRPGTRFAGQAVRNDSYGLEIYSPYQDKELPENIIYDCGDLEMAVGSPRWRWIRSSRASQRSFRTERFRL